MSTAPEPPLTAPTLSSLTSRLLPTTSLVHPPSKTHTTDPRLAASIAALQLHPTLEATLHLLNADLPSTHFLVRHMQAPPAVEGMLLHAILHRCEGDMRNARAWAGDVRDACEGWVPKRKGVERLERGVWEGCGLVNGGRTKIGLLEFVYGDEKFDGLERLIGDVEKVRGSDRNTEDEAKIEERIQSELGRILEWCKMKFGEVPWLDASQAWVRHSEEVRQVSEDMVSGNKGWRKF